MTGRLRAPLVIAALCVGVTLLGGGSLINATTPATGYGVDGQAPAIAAANAPQPSYGQGAVFDLNIASIGSGPTQRSSALTVNSTPMTLLADYDARDISGVTWPARGGVAGTLAETGGGGSPTAGQPAPFTEAAARAVSYGHAKFHDGSPTAIGTQDYALELVTKFVDGGGTLDLLSDQDLNTTGFEVQSLAGGTLRVIHADGTIASTSIALASGTWIDLLCFGKRSGSLRCYVDGQFTMQVDISARTGSITSTNGLEIGGVAANPGAESSSSVATFRAWKCNACLNTTGEMDTIAQQRTAQLAGFYPQIAAGGQTPTLATRASSASIDVDRDGDGTRRVFLVGSNWPRVAKRKDSGATARAGVLAEDATTKLFLQNRHLENAAWTDLNVTVTADTTVAPDLSTTADSIAQTAGAGVSAHCVTQAPTLTAAGYVASVYLAPSTRTFAYVNDSTIANGAAWINLSTCAAGTKQAGVTTLAAESWGGAAGWCRIGIAFVGTAAAHTIQICAASADNTTTYDGGAGTAVQMIAWNAEVEANSTTQPSSPIETTSATVTRAGDGLRWTMPTTLGVVSTYTVVADVLFPGAMGATDRVPWVIEDTPTAVNFVEMDEFGSTLAVLGNGGLLAQGGNVFDNVYHRTRATIASSNTALFIDGSQVATDLTHAKPTIASGLVCVGSGISGGGANLNALVGRLTIYPFTTTALP